MKAHVWVTNCQACMCIGSSVDHTKSYPSPLIMYCLVPVWMTFQKLTELLQFNWCWHLLKPCLEARRVIVCFLCFSPMPPLGYLTACGAWLAPALLFMSILVLGPVTRALVKCPAGSREWRFWLCGIWGLWQYWRINYKYKSIPVVDSAVITKDLSRGPQTWGTFCACSWL